MALCIIKEWCNVEIELQPLLCEVNLNVGYAFSQTALRGHIDPTVKSKCEKMGVRAWRGGEGRETGEEERVTHQRQNKRLICAKAQQQYFGFVTLLLVFFLCTSVAYSCWNTLSNVVTEGQHNVIGSWICQSKMMVLFGSSVQSFGSDYYEI